MNKTLASKALMKFRNIKRYRLIGKVLTNCCPFVKFSSVLLRQTFVLHGSIDMLHVALYV